MPFMKQEILRAKNRKLLIVDFNGALEVYECEEAILP